MHFPHQTVAGLTLILGAGTLIVAGLICACSSQVQILVDFLRDRDRRRRQAAGRVDGV